MPHRLERTRSTIAIYRSLGLLRKTPGKVPRQVPPRLIERDYGRALAAYLRPRVRAAFAPLLAELPGILERAAAARRAALDRLDAGEDRVRALIDQARASLRSSIRGQDLADLATRFARQTASHQRTQLNRQTRSALGVDVLAAEPGLPMLVEGWTSANVELITGLSDRAAVQVSGTVMQGVSEGRLWQDIAKEVEKDLGVPERRAELIARDQVGKLYGQINAARQREAGITRFIWRTVRDERVRDEHDARDGEIYEYADPPDGELPGEPILCFPGGIAVSSDAPVRKAYRRWYRGESTIIQTGDGRVLESTPNHPILTLRGWLPAHALDVGDYVVQAPAQRLDVTVPYRQQPETRIADVFDALAPLGITERRRGLAGWFHGDAAVDEDVEVVDVERLLHGVRDVEISQTLAQYVLTRADESTLRPSHLDLCFDGGGSPASLVRGSGKLLALVARRAPHAVEHGVAAAAWLDALAYELRSDGRARDAEALREFLHARPAGMQLGDHLAGIVGGIWRRAVDPAARLHTPSAEELAQGIAVDAEQPGRLGDRVRLEQCTRVVEKRVGELACHVYNLQTESSWYVAQNLIVHNCRCYAEPVLDDLLEG